MTLYFGYGSNLDGEDWGGFCARNGHQGAQLAPQATALLLDHELAFDCFSRTRRGGVLNLRARAGQAAEGVLFRANDMALAALDAKEGAPFAYRRVLRHVVLPDGTVAEAMTYVSRSEPFRAPHADYLGIVRRGQAAHGVGHGMLDAVACGQASPLTVAHVFVYGTLMAGEANAHHLDGLPRMPGTVRGALHDCGPYPALGLGLGVGVGEVRGEVLELPLDRLAAMDALEGCPPGGAPGGMYRRSVLDVRTDRGALRAYTYVMDDAGRFPRLQAGDWRAKPGRHADWAAYAAATPAADR
jgi:gamma-glutamylcyclotransferase (GGCT)/AIG2-like uncharacterized protein YtfP